MTASIPAAIRRKFAQIERHQRAIRRLVSECQIAMGIDDTVDPDSGWDWGSFVTANICTPESAERYAEMMMKIRDEAKAAP